MKPHIPFTGSGFESAASRSLKEAADRQNISERMLSYGIRFLDAVTFGIWPDDLVILGAPSGSGKTQLCVNIALHNILKGKRVHMIALEAAKNEIERRMKYGLLSDLFYQDKARPKIGEPLSYAKWYLGRYKAFIKPYEDYANMHMADFENFFTFYKDKEFTEHTMQDALIGAADDTDLFLIDHIHYFDFTNESENKSIKLIVQKARYLTQVLEKPIILVSHLRKRDKLHSDLVAGQEDFHGSSELIKAATTGIAIAPGEPVPFHADDDGEDRGRRFYTYMRVNKCRVDNPGTGYVARAIFDAGKRAYEGDFELGRLVKGGKEWVGLSGEEIPPAVRSENERLKQLERGGSSGAGSHGA